MVDQLVNSYIISGCSQHGCLSCVRMSMLDINMHVLQAGPKLMVSPGTWAGADLDCGRVGETQRR